MTENTLVPIDVSNLPSVDEKKFKDLTATASFLPRIQLYGANSGPVKEGLIGMGHFGFVHSKENIEDLGKEVDCIPLNWHFKAMRIADGEVDTSLDPESELFQEIQASADDPDSGCMYGIEFLIWLPSEGGRYCTLFLNSVSSRRIAGDIRGLLGKGASLGVRLVKTKRYSWHAPKVTANSTPFPVVPDVDEINEKVELFNKEPEKGETVSDTNERDR